MRDSNLMRCTKTRINSMPAFFKHVLLILASVTFSVNALAEPQIVNPSTGSTLSGTTQTFSWTIDSAEVERVWLYVGTTVGGRDIVNSGDLGTATKYDVVGLLPVDGSTIHARFWYYSTSRWFYVDTIYTAADLDLEIASPAIESPANNSELTGTSVDFNWISNNTPVNFWWLYLGTTQGGKDLYNSGTALRSKTSVTFDELPADGSDVHARLWFRTSADGWKYADSVYRTNNGGGDFNAIPLVSNITSVQPMTGIVLWADSHNSSLLKTASESVQLEYAYLDPSKTVIGEGNYDWSSLESTLEAVRARGKQMVLRFAYAFPGQTTKVPNYLKSLPGYNETSGITEGRQTYFPDWSNAALQKAHIDLYTAFAARYDNDPRIAFLQVGFGLWSEYHIYQPGVQLGVNFPSKAFQSQFLNHMDNVFNELHWSVSIDAGVQSVSALQSGSSLMNLDFGVFDDSFMHENHGSYNQSMWNHFNYPQRYKQSVLGGEFSYYTSFDQQNVLNPEGIHGRTFADESEKFHISYMIGNDQPNYQSNERIKAAGLSTGYRFKVTSFYASSSESKVTVTNTGVAPIYYDAYVTVNNVAANSSLKGLLPGASADFTIASGGTNPVLTIEADRLVDGQRIEFEANL